MSVRSAPPRFAVMRTLGFPSSTIFLLIAGEGLMVAICRRWSASPSRGRSSTRISCRWGGLSWRCNTAVPSLPLAGLMSCDDGVASSTRSGASRDVLETHNARSATRHSRRAEPRRDVDRLPTTSLWSTIVRTAMTAGGAGIATLVRHEAAEGFKAGRLGSIRVLLLSAAPRFLDYRQRRRPAVALRASGLSAAAAATVPEPCAADKFVETGHRGNAVGRLGPSCRQRTGSSGDTAGRRRWTADDCGVRVGTLGRRGRDDAGLSAQRLSIDYRQVVADPPRCSTRFRGGQAASHLQPKNGSWSTTPTVTGDDDVYLGR